MFPKNRYVRLKKLRSDAIVSKLLKWRKISVYFLLLPDEAACDWLVFDLLWKQDRLLTSALECVHLS